MLPSSSFSGFSKNNHRVTIFNCPRNNPRAHVRTQAQGARGRSQALGLGTELTRLIAREYFIDCTRRESLKSYTQINFVFLKTFVISKDVKEIEHFKM
jgi:hypothetical protein